MRVIFHEGEIEPPDMNLGGGSGSQVAQTADLVKRLEQFWIRYIRLSSFW